MKKGITHLFILFLALVYPSLAFAEKQTLYVDKGIIYTAAGEPLITALKAGKASIAATTDDGEIMWSVDVEVK
tara:strand:- start:277 stop:495 length:219 start_codon:yes stop_codon:yes gene_type:complete